MIRRDIPLSSDPKHWLLLSQIEHARLSGELAKAWRAGRSDSSAGLFPALEEPIRTELLAAIRHHDDGWAAWEANPPIDSRVGRPDSFLELPRDESLVIWRDSIEVCRRIGPLAGWVVAGHFARLLRDSDDADTTGAQKWLAEIEKDQEVWLADWIQANRLANGASLAQDGLFFLRLFDWLSLWLCCQCPAITGDAPAKPMILDEGPLRDAPICFKTTDESPAFVAGDPRTVYVAPWPFAEPEVSLDALGYAVPVKAYASSEELAKRRMPRRLRWRLVPG